MRLTARSPITVWTCQYFVGHRDGRVRKASNTHAVTLSPPPPCPTSSDNHHQTIITIIKMAQSPHLTTTYAIPKPILPHPSTRWTQVRAFLIEYFIYMSDGECPRARAQDMAKRPFGITGKDLYRLPAKVFVGFWGEEIGLSVYNYVQDSAYGNVWYGADGMDKLLRWFLDWAWPPVSSCTSRMPLAPPALPLPSSSPVSSSLSSSTFNGPADKGGFIGGSA